MRRLLCWLRVAHTPIRTIDKVRLRDADSTGFSFAIEAEHYECRYCRRRMS